MADLLLDVVLVDLGRRGKAGHIASDRQILLARKLGRIAAQAGGKRSLLDETRDLLIVELVRSEVLALAGDATEEGPLVGLANLVQVSMATTGYVVSAEQRLAIRRTQGLS